MGCRCDAHKKQVDVKQWYNPVQLEVQLVGVRVLEIRCQHENQFPQLGLAALRAPGWAAQENEKEVLL